jgi:hypothetical protein
MTFTAVARCPRTGKFGDPPRVRRQFGGGSSRGNTPASGSPARIPEGRRCTVNVAQANTGANARTDG